MATKKPRILVVEDEKPLARIIQDKLSAIGFEYNSAATVDDALIELGSSQYDLIWLDHYLIGQQSGLDLVSKIKQKESLRNIPIFVVSNTAPQDKVQTYMKLGVDNYYIKSENTLEDIITDIKKTIGVE